MMLIQLNLDYPDLSYLDFSIIQIYFSAPSFSLILIICHIFVSATKLFSFKLCDETAVELISVDYLDHSAQSPEPGCSKAD